LPVQLIDGKALAELIRNDISKRVASLKSQGRAVGLHAVLVGDDAAAESYAESQAKHAHGAARQTENAHSRYQLRYPRRQTPALQIRAKSYGQLRRAGRNEGHIQRDPAPSGRPGMSSRVLPPTRSYAPNLAPMVDVTMCLSRTREFSIRAANSCGGWQPLPMGRRARRLASFAAKPNDDEFAGVQGVENREQWH